MAYSEYLKYASKQRHFKESKIEPYIRYLENNTFFFEKKLENRAKKLFSFPEAIGAAIFVIDKREKEQRDNYQKELLKNKSLLTKKNLEQIDTVLKFCDKKSKYKMSTIYIPRSSKYFEKAHFQHFSGGKYWPSPFGRYEHFKKVISREGLRKYKPYLDGEKLFYIRLLKKVPAKEIHKIS